MSSLDSKLTPAEIVDDCSKSDSLEMTIKKIVSVIDEDEKSIETNISDDLDK